MLNLFRLPTIVIFLSFFILGILPSLDFYGDVLAIMFVLFAGYFVYFLGNSLYKKLPVKHDLNVRRFNMRVLFCVLYVAIVMAMSLLYNSGDRRNYTDLEGFVWIIIPFHLLAMYCMFYAIWFIAKCIATVENGKVVYFDTYAGLFFLLWFFPIGVWWIHPKLQKIFFGTDESLADDLKRR